MFFYVELDTRLHLYSAVFFLSGLRALVVTGRIIAHTPASLCMGTQSLREREAAYTRSHKHLNTTDPEVRGPTTRM